MMLRTRFAGIDMKGLHQENDWCELNASEIDIIQKAIERRQKLEQASLAPVASGKGLLKEDEDGDEEDEE
jgi:hypothetical protein